MKYTVEEISQVQRKVSVEVAAQDVQDVRSQVIKKYQKEAKFKGFRPGKAPLSLVESNYAPQIHMDTMEDLINLYYPQMLGQSQLIPINQPKFNVETPDLDKDFTFTAEFDIKPVIELVAEDYLGIELKEPDLQVTDELGDTTIKQLMGSKATLTSIEEKRPAAANDVVVVDYQTFDSDNTPLEDKVSDADLDLTPGALLPEVEAALLGAQAGDRREAVVDFDENVQTPQFRGKKVRFDMEVKGLKEKKLPELTDEFVKNTWPQMDSVDKLKQQVRDDLAVRFEQQKAQALRQQMIAHIGTLGDFEVPPSLVQSEKESMLSRFKQYMQQGEGDANPAALEDEALLSEVEESAHKKVKAGLVLGRIAELENVEVEQKDLEEELARQAGNYPVESVREFYLKNNMMHLLVGNVLEEKTLARVKEAATIVKVDPDELKNENNEND